MEKLAVSHRYAGVIEKLATKLSELNGVERQTLSVALLQRIEADPRFRDLGAFRTNGTVKPDPADLDKLGRMVSSHLRITLRDLDLTETEMDQLRVVVIDVSQPLVELVELYLKPRTFLQKMKRYWRMQRMGVKAIQIMSRPVQPGRQVVPTLVGYKPSIRPDA